MPRVSPRRNASLIDSLQHQHFVAEYKDCKAVSLFAGRPTFHPDSILALRDFTLPQFFPILVRQPLVLLLAKSVFQLMGDGNIH
jgi:hypothetical protein